MKKRINGNSSLSILALFAFVFIFIYLIVSFYPRRYSDIIEKNAERFGLEPSLVYAVIKTESGYNERAASYKGAKGLMQIMDKTGEWAFMELGIDAPFSPELLFDPEINIEIGCWYLGRLLKQFDAVDAALAAYNAGSGNVSSWIKNPDYFDGNSLYNIPFGETKSYVKKVNTNKMVYEKLRGLSVLKNRQKQVYTADNT